MDKPKSSNKLPEQGDGNPAEEKGFRRKKFLIALAADAVIGALIYWQIKPANFSLVKLSDALIVAAAVMLLFSFKFFHPSSRKDEMSAENGKSSEGSGLVPEYAFAAAATLAAAVVLLLL